MAPTRFGYITPENLPLFTDLYELTMLQGYYNQDHNPVATFDLYFRKLPSNRGYVIAAGLEQVVHYAENLSFGPRAITYLSDQGFDEDFLSHLETLTFTGDVSAVPEGTPVFPNEPLLEVTAPLIQSQFIETIAINQVGYQSLVATKAARMRDAVDRYGDGQSLVDFGSRRAHGTDAGVKAARAAVVGGFDGTSNVAAGEAFDVPVFGTMAHSWVQSFESERAAFETFVDEYGDESILLIDTYDTVEGARVARDVAAERGVDLAGVRLDSGDLSALSAAVRDVLPDVDVFVSSGIDEYAIREFLQSDGVATGFGPGTALTTSADAPKLDAVYKLVAVERDGTWQPSMKLSAGKVTYPARKRVRRVERDGQYRYDVLSLADEESAGDDLLVPILEGGRLQYEFPDLPAIRERTGRNVRRLPSRSRRLTDPGSYEVRVSPDLESLRTDLRDRLAR